ncbi:MAG: hypothetical protein ABII07_02580 [Patescibacteria group bacterium]|nr:hypothetical protein [Patescibacteria group bacterium]
MEHQEYFDAAWEDPTAPENTEGPDLDALEKQGKQLVGSDPRANALFTSIRSKLAQVPNLTPAAVTTAVMGALSAPSFAMANGWEKYAAGVYDAPKEVMQAVADPGNPVFKVAAAQFALGFVGQGLGDIIVNDYVKDKYPILKGDKVEKFLITIAYAIVALAIGFADYWILHMPDHIRTMLMINCGIQIATNWGFGTEDDKNRYGWSELANAVGMGLVATGFKLWG